MTEAFVRTRKSREARDHPFDPAPCNVLWFGDDARATWDDCWAATDGTGDELAKQRNDGHVPPCFEETWKEEERSCPA